MDKVFLYAGQGSQRVGMGKDFYEEFKEYRSLIDSLDPGFPIKEYMHEGPEEELVKTEHTQPCMAAFAAGVTRVLKANGINPAAACGLSLGEYGALFAAGVFSEEDYIRLVTYRGQAMADAAAGLSCSMSAILGIMDSSVIEEAANSYDGGGYVTVANYNCPGQTVICGDEEAVSALEEQLKEKGAKRCIRLKVSGPFHTRYMQSAGERLKDYFSNIKWNRPGIDVACNVTGNIIRDEDIQELLIRQVQQSVRLEDDLKALINAGYTDYIEIGPGNTMAGFLKKTAKALKANITVSSIDTVDDLKKIL